MCGPCAAVGYHAKLETRHTAARAELRRHMPKTPCLIHLGSTPMLYLVVSDIEVARATLLDRGVDVSEAFHRGAGPGSQSAKLLPRLPHLAIWTAMPGWSRKSPSDCPVEWTRTRHLHILDRACGSAPTCSAAWQAREAYRPARSGSGSRRARSRRRKVQLQSHILATRPNVVA
jgi:hypothetical protein